MLLLFGSLVLGACADRELVGVADSPAHARVVGVVGTYEVTFHVQGFHAIGPGVESAVVNTEMAVRANVRGSDGQLATVGSVTFERCELRRNPAPAAECISGQGTWRRVFSIQMDPSGYPPTVHGGICSSPTVIGFRFRYDGKRGAIANGMSAPRDFAWVAAAD
jgi:hypothetical protein